MVKRNPFLFWIACLVSVGGILYGYDIGVISGALLFMQQSIPMTDTQTGVIVGAVLGGSLVGTLAAGPVGDRFGRRLLIMLSSLLFMVGVTLVVMAHSFFCILCARLLLGVGVGVIAVAVPLYVAEIVPAKDRGKYVTFFQLLLTFGIVAAYFVDLIFTPSGNWRAMFGMVLIPAVILMVGMWFLPESPRWLIGRGEVECARRILQRVRRSTEEVERDIRMIQKSLHSVQGGWSELFSPTFILPACVAIAIAIFNQLTGINSFLQYAPLILKNAGISSNLVSMLGSVGIGILNFISTILAITLIDTLGRRPLLLIGVAGVMISECYLGLVSYLPFSPATTGMLSMLGLFAFIIFFAIGPGVVVWLAISELFPTRVRGKGMALCLFFNSLASTLLATFFLPLSHWLGMSQAYSLFALFTFAYLLLTIYFLPETKTKSLEEIQFEFEQRV